MSVSGRDRQVIYLYLPCLPVRRLIRLNGWPEQDKTALYQRIKGADRLVYLSATAQQAGLQADMSVADARAGFPISGLRRLTMTGIVPCSLRLPGGPFVSVLLSGLMPLVWGCGLMPPGPVIYLAGFRRCVLICITSSARPALWCIWPQHQHSLLPGHWRITIWRPQPGRFMPLTGDIRCGVLV